MKLLEHEMNVVERVLEKRHGRIVAVNKIQIGSTPERGTINAVFILRLQEEYHVKGKKLFYGPR